MKNSVVLVVFVLNLSCLCLAEYNSNYYGTTSNQRPNTFYTTGSRNNLEWSDYTYSIDQGNCMGDKLVDEDVRKDADPYTNKKTTYTWNGRDMYQITCIRVLNRMARDKNAAEARISEGGVGKTSVRIEMRGQDSQMIHYHVEIWGKQTARQSNVAFMTRMPNDVLYLNGKKYCECH